VFWLWLHYQGIEVKFPALQYWWFSAATRPDWCRNHSNVPFNEYQWICVLEKSAGIWNSPFTVSSDDFENEWSYDSIPTYAFVVCCAYGLTLSYSILPFYINPLNVELNPIWHLLALLGAHHIFHVSRIRVKHCKNTSTINQQMHIYNFHLKHFKTLKTTPTCFDLFRSSPLAKVITYSRFSSFL